MQKKKRPESLFFLNLHKVRVYQSICMGMPIFFLLYDSHASSYYPNNSNAHLKIELFFQVDNYSRRNLSQLSLLYDPHFFFFSLSFDFQERSKSHLIYLSITLIELILLYYIIYVLYSSSY